MPFRVPAFLTNRPVACEHVGEIWDDVEGSVDDDRHEKVDDEVVGDVVHPGVGHHDPDD